MKVSTYTLSWICKQPLLFRGWGKTGLAHSFPTLTSESINLVQKLGYLGGEKLGRPILSPPRLVKVSTYTLSWICKQPLLFRGWGKTGPAHSFPTLTTESISLLVHEARTLSGWRKTGPAHSFPMLTTESINLVQKLGYLGGEKLGWSVTVPTLTSDSINLTLSWIYKQPLLFRGWGKTGLAQSFPNLTSERINLVQKLGYLGGEKPGRPILSPPRLVKVSAIPCHEYANKFGWSVTFPPWQLIASTLPCHEYTNNLCLCRGWGKTGLAQSFPNSD